MTVRANLRRRGEGGRNRYIGENQQDVLTPYLKSTRIFKLVSVRKTTGSKLKIQNGLCHSNLAAISANRLCVYATLLHTAHAQIALILLKRNQL